MRQRWYDPNLQRFISRDKLRNSNRYAYAQNKPTTLIDPSGLDPVFVGPGGNVIQPPFGGQIPSQAQNDRCKALAAYRLLQLYSQSKNGAYDKYVTTLDNVRIERGSLWFGNASTWYDVSFGWTIDLDNSVLSGNNALIAWTLLHESVHVYQGWSGNLNPFTKENLPYQVASQDVLKDITQFYNNLTPQQKNSLSCGCP